MGTLIVITWITMWMTWTGESHPWNVGDMTLNQTRIGEL